jgi:K+-transporting ATPase ATPase C chain
MDRRFWTDHLRPCGVLLALCALLVLVVYPGTLAVIDLGVNPTGAIGSPMYCNGTSVGSSLVAENITNASIAAKFFHPRAANASASGVDPDLTPEQAYAQVPGISNATGIAPSSLDFLIDRDVQDNTNQNGFTAPNYVSVNQLNLDLISLYPSVYKGVC